MAGAMNSSQIFCDIHDSFIVKVGAAMGFMGFLKRQLRG